MALYIGDFLKKYKIELSIFTIAILAQVFLFLINLETNNFALIPTIHGDDGYFEISRSLVEGRGFTSDDAPPFFPNPLRPPVYPFFIAGILFAFKSYWAVIGIQMILGATIPVLGMRIARHIVDSANISFVVGLFLVVEPLSLLLTSIFYTETVFVFLFFLFLLFFFKYFKDPSYRNIIWGALFLGLATLTKPTVQYLPLLVPFFILWHHRKNISKRIVLQIVTFVALFLITISPWLYRNHVEFDVAGMSAQPAFNVYVYLVSSVLAIENSTSFATELETHIGSRDVDINEITLTNSREHIELALPILLAHPVALVKSFGVSLITFFTHDGVLGVLRHAGYVPETPLSQPALFLLLDNPKEFFEVFKELIATPALLVLLGRITWVILTLTAMWGMFSMIVKRRLDVVGAFAIFLIFYFAGTSVIGGLGVNARHRMPINVFIFIFSAYGSHLIYAYLKDFIAKRKNLHLKQKSET